mmetsp:Transcript_35694/g.87804  ORF Transcript_35694/g.87804 Transcript_35694/m.87804 type:complete len:95 (-) Transcript_35694:228-512(-)
MGRASMRMAKQWESSNKRAAAAAAVPVSSRTTSPAASRRDLMPSVAEDRVIDWDCVSEGGASSASSAGSSAGGAAHALGGLVSSRFLRRAYAKK